uniref:cell surface A33 antigen isoform X2 n=1 Tax=Doryrhamphus excisus TaxID=161450 RepID=UPI0025AE6897|nr:cell surface A33 antigen isoform X2 [Doryrhamphus excisus]
MAAARKQIGWLDLLFILTVLTGCRSLQVSIPQKEYVAANGDDITLTCSFIPAKLDFSILLVTWEAHPDDTEDTMKTVATFFLNNPVDIAPDYEGRAFLEVDVARQQSTLRLTKLTVKDSRSFQCSVKIPNDDEGTTAASASLLVLVAPSAPLCRLQGTAEYWHDVTLTCKSEEGSPKPSYQWKSYSVENIPRQFPPKTTEKDGTLSLFNISRETSGFFICLSTNRVGSASCNFTLAVIPGGTNIGATAGIIGGVIAGIIVLGIVIFSCCKKRGEKDKHAKGEMEFSDKGTGTQYRDEESDGVTQQTEYKDAVLQNHHCACDSDGENNDGDGTQRYQDSQHDHRRRDHLDEKRFEERNEHRGSRDRLGNWQGSRDRLDDQRNRYGGSWDRLDECHEYRGSRNRLHDQRDHYGRSRDRLEEQRQYRGSGERLNDPRDRYGGSWDRLNNPYDR